MKGDILEAEGRHHDAILAYRQAVESVHGDLMLGMVDEALGKLIRSLALAGRASEADAPLADLRRIAPGRSNSEATLAWAEGMLATEPDTRIERLRAAVGGFHRIGRLVDEARARLDLANILDAIGRDAIGRDGTVEREHARAMLEEHSIVVFAEASPAGSVPD